MRDADQVERGRDRAEELLGQRRAIRGRPRPGTLIAEGDSWFDYPGADILSVLEDRFGWDVLDVAKGGDTVESMAYDSSQLESLLRTFERAKRFGVTPKGILLSGGGNDFAGPELAMLLEHARSVAAR